MTNNISDFKKRVYFILRIIVITALSVLILTFAHSIVFLIFGGMLLALLFHAAGGVLKKIIPIPQVWLAMISGVLIVGGLGVLIWLLGAQIADQLGQVGQRITEALSQLSEAVPALQPLVEKVQSLNLQDLFSSSGNAWGRLGGALITTATIVTNVVFLVFLGFFFAAEPSAYREGTLHLFPEESIKNIRNIAKKIATTLQRWMSGQLISMAIVGVFTGLGLWALGVPLPVALALIAALVSFIPNIGPLIALIPGVLVAFTVSPLTVLWVFLLYVGIQFVESNLITPNIQRKAVALPPGLILSSQLIFGALFGLAGLALATPIIATLAVVLEERRKQKERE